MGNISIEELHINVISHNESMYSDFILDGDFRIIVGSCNQVLHQLAAKKASCVLIETSP